LATRNGTKPKTTISAFKAIVIPVFAVRDEKGEVIDEITPNLENGQPVQISLYRPDFDNLAEKLDELQPQVEQALAAQTE
jgi:hypothetical protein